MVSFTFKQMAEETKDERDLNEVFNFFSTNNEDMFHQLSCTPSVNPVSI